MAGANPPPEVTGSDDPAHNQFDLYWHPRPTASAAWYELETVYGNLRKRHRSFLSRRKEGTLPQTTYFRPVDLGQDPSLTDINFTIVENYE